MTQETDDFTEEFISVIDEAGKKVWWKILESSQTVVKRKYHDPYYLQRGIIESSDGKCMPFTRSLPIPKK